MTERLRDVFLVASHELLEVYSSSRTDAGDVCHLPCGPPVSPAPAAVSKPEVKDAESSVISADTSLVYCWVLLTHV